MTPETSRLIAETLRLDGEATVGPWNHIEGDGSVWNDDDMGRCVANTDHCANMNMDINAELIASYRTSAPRLARMLEVAVKAMTAITAHPDCDVALTKIERIAKGEA